MASLPEIVRLEHHAPTLFVKTEKQLLGQYNLVLTQRKGIGFVFM